MPLGHCEAAKVFLGTPELVEKLLPFADLETTFHLAQTYRVTREKMSHLEETDEERLTLQQEAGIS